MKDSIINLNTVEKERGIQIYITERDAETIALLSILGRCEPLIQDDIDSLSMLVPQEPPKKIDKRFWARKQADKKLRKFK